MQRIEINYNPYRLETQMKINGIDITVQAEYQKFNQFISMRLPLQNWIEPIPFKNWKGLINELVSEDTNDTLAFYFKGREIDFEDLIRSCEAQNQHRPKEHRVRFDWQSSKNVLSDITMSQNIETIVQELQSKRFQALVKERKENTSLQERYNNLGALYQQTKNQEFKIIFAGLYSSGKSTILNALIQKDILTASDKTCTNKICYIRHAHPKKGIAILQCLDANDKIIIPPETFDTEENCKARFKELNSQNDTIERIELFVDLSHLYPSSEMEEKFQIVLVDTPGTNSGDTERAGSNKHLDITMTSINDTSKSMVVICAEGSKTEDKSIGELLKEIICSSKEDNGAFNDRFLFVLNKCDQNQYEEERSLETVKSEFSEYITKGNYLLDDIHFNFTPRIFTICAQAAMAVVKHIDALPTNVMNSREIAYHKIYSSMHTSIINYGDENFFLSKYCDIPAYRKDENEEQFQHFLNHKEEAKAVEIQCGVNCLVQAIRDYIERYAYPIKVKKLLQTFDAILSDVTEFVQIEERLLSEKTVLNANVKNEKSNKEKEVQNIATQKQLLESFRNKAENIKRDIKNIPFSTATFNKILDDLNRKLANEKSIIELRNCTNGNKKYTEKEATRLLKDVGKAYQNLYHDAYVSFDKFSNDYKKKLEDVIKKLNTLALEMQEDKYKINDFNLVNTIAYKTFEENLSFSALENLLIEGKGQEKIPNPRKQEYHFWYEILPKIKQLFEPSYITQDVYNLKAVIDSLDKTSNEFDESIHACRDSYKNYLENMQAKSSSLIEDLLSSLKDCYRDLNTLTSTIASISCTLEELESSHKKTEATLNWLRQLKSNIEGV